MGHTLREQINFNYSYTHWEKFPRSKSIRFAPRNWELCCFSTCFQYILCMYIIKVFGVFSISLCISNCITENLGWQSCFSNTAISASQCTLSPGFTKNEDILYFHSQFLYTVKLFSLLLRNTVIFPVNNLVVTF